MASRADELKKLMYAETSEEKACQEFLHDIASHLVPFRIREENILERGREEPSRPGDSDFCVSVEVDNGAMGRRFAYIWEVKAPQKYLFQRDGARNRLRPTDDLYSAENQLINYVAELNTSKNFRHKFQLTGADDEVRLGGIIIGRKDRIVKGLAEDASLKGLARNAFTTREALFWGPANLQVRTWDWVLEQLKHDEQGGHKSTATVDTTHIANPQVLLASASDLLSSRDELVLRAAVTYAYAAAELTVMPGGWNGGRPSPQQVVLEAAKSEGRHGIAVLFRRLSEIRNRSVHGFKERVTEDDAAWAIRAAEQFCQEWNVPFDGAQPDDRASDI
ncbi:hypothetical protein BG58_32930 [Caballeronia jiangsuensis]|nr:hypothetical protein BG58_32930 [Caballeronia jiangsuensis]